MLPIERLQAVERARGEQRRHEEDRVWWELEVDVCSTLVDVVQVLPLLTRHGAGSADVALVVVPVLVAFAEEEDGACARADERWADAEEEHDQHVRQPVVRLQVDT